MVFETQTHRKAIWGALVSMLFFSSLILLLTAQVGPNRNLTYGFLAGFFGLCVLLSLWALLNIRKIQITRTEMVLKKGLLYRTIRYRISEITELKESPYKIEPQTGNFGTKTLVHEGKSLTLHFASGEVLEFTTFDTKDYPGLARTLKSLHTGKHTPPIPVPTYDASKALIFFGLLLTGILLAGSILIFTA